jgi:hypothetical protein
LAESVLEYGAEEDVWTSRVRKKLETEGNLYVEEI